MLSNWRLCATHTCIVHLDTNVNATGSQEVQWAALSIPDAGDSWTSVQYHDCAHGSILQVFLLWVIN